MPKVSGSPNLKRYLHPFGGCRPNETAIKHPVITSMICLFLHFVMAMFGNLTSLIVPYHAGKEFTRCNGDLVVWQSVV